MKLTMLFSAISLTSFIAFTPCSLAEQNSSAKQPAPQVTPAVAPIKKKQTTEDNSFKMPEPATRHKREFTDALITDVKLPDDDPAHKPEDGFSSSSASSRINNSRK